MAPLILDVGSGRYPNNPIHISRGQVNIDIDKTNPHVPNFIRADAHHLPFRGGMFEKVFFYDVIEHVENPCQCLREIRRVLQDGGELELSTPNPLHWRKFFRVLRGKSLELSGKEHISTWTDVEMRILLERAGFQQCTIRYVILPATEKSDASRHILLDKLVYRLLPNGATGRNMIVHAHKTERVWARVLA